MENGTAVEAEQHWNFCRDEDGEPERASAMSIRAVLYMIRANLDDRKPPVPLGHGDPSAFPRFQTPTVAEDAIIDALRSANFNHYSSPANGFLSVRSYLDHIDSPCPSRCQHSASKARLSYYETRAMCCNLEVRCFDLLPDQRWEIDLQSVETLSYENTIAIVVINPGNPCGSVAEMARKLRILVIADEVYERLTFGSTPFVPVVTLGSISNRWSVPGWRLGWLVTNDPNGILRKTGGALPNIIQNTMEDYFSKIIEALRETADICYNTIKEIPCITCPNKPEGSMLVMVKLNVSLLDDINDDLDFCLKLAKEESVMVLPGVTVGMKNWLRITFAVELSVLQDGLEWIKAFCQRHAKKQ
ncbi:Tyrosine aminotransferase [Morus notabilis]|uniref:Tyrosine aminotransferase n=1 Tax=Morus notabilis TaxID=981085 RepID=W9RA64_9ROSA|nr:Tyrosine aminotransferase [Morus notabilis]